MQLSAVWGKADTLQGVQQGAGRTQGSASAGWAAAAARPLPSVPEPARHRHALLPRHPREQVGWEAQRRAEVSPAAALEMRMQPQGRQGHIPDMSWLNKAIYQRRVDTAELGTESQRALAAGPCGTRGAWGALRGGRRVPGFGATKKAALCRALRGEKSGHRAAQGCPGRCSRCARARLVPLSRGARRPRQRRVPGG